MKQQIVLIGLVFAVMTAFSQTNNSTPNSNGKTVVRPPKKEKPCFHRVWADFGTAYTNNIYNRFNKFEPNALRQDYSFSNLLEVGYAYYFHPKFGVGLGVGLSKIWAKATLGTNTYIPGYRDSNYIPDNIEVPSEAELYDKWLRSDGLKEKQAIWAIEIPLTFQFETRFGRTKRNGLLATVGVKGYLPIPKARIYFKEGEVAQRGYDEWLNVKWPEDMPVHFERKSMQKTFAQAKMSPSVDIIGNVGGLIGLTRRADLYLGVYASYGFMDILPKERENVNFVEGDYLNGLLNSNTLDKYSEKYPDVKVSTKWNLFQAGIKVGVRVKACGQRRQSFYEDKRDFLDKYGDQLANAKNNEPKKPLKEDEPKKNDSEPVYIMPIVLGNPSPARRGGGAGGGALDSIPDDDFPENMNPIVKDLLKYLLPRTNPANPNNDRFNVLDDDPANDPAVRQLLNSLTNAQIYFDLDKDIPNRPRIAHNEVEKAVFILKNNPDIKIIIAGYTCRLGSQAHNEDLAQRRANTVRNMFIARGVNPEQVDTETFTVANYPWEVRSTFHTLEDARTVIFRIERLKK